MRYLPFHFNRSTMRYLLPFCCLLLFGACSPRLTPFTEALYDDFGWSEDDLQKIQFYVSRDIELKRQLSAGSSQIVSGKIRIENGREVEVVTIQRGTPGVFVFSPKSDRFAVSFEADDQFLIFGPNPRSGGRFTLRAADWTRNSGVVTYGNQKYRVSSDAAYAALLIDLKKVTRTQRQARVARGRKVD